MNLRAALAQISWLVASAPAHRRFRRALRDPAAAQNRLLRELIRRNSASDYGRAHGFESIRSYADFARQVPVVTYDELAPWIARIQRGDRGVLTEEPVTRLLPTSGSTQARKLIPFTASLQRGFNAAIGPWITDLCGRHPAIALGPAYWSVTPLAAEFPPSGATIPVGFDEDSRYLGGARAALVEAAMAVPSAVRHVRDVAAFRRAVLLCLLRRADLRLISIWHPSFLVLLLDLLAAEWESLLDDLATGRDDAIPAKLRPAFRFRPEPRLAARLRHSDPRQPESIWPNFTLASAWADGHATGPAAELRRRLPGVAFQAKGLLATEAFVTLPFDEAHPVAVESHFFEFADEGGAISPVENLIVGRRYEIIVTTGGGLWRYQLGDRVEVTGFVDRTPSLRFLGRTGAVSDLCGEKLSDAFIAETIRTVCGQPAFALLAPEESAAGWRYSLYLEAPFVAGLDLRLDGALRANPHYAWCRDLGQLAPLKVHWLPPGAYAAYAAAEAARGRRLGDIKPAALSTKSDWSQVFAVHRPQPAGA